MVPNPQAKRILCYGDSNTWGQSPIIKGERFAADRRWTGIAQQRLGAGYTIIEEGLSSRTTDLDYAAKPGRNGRIYFQPCLESQNPLDMVVIMLGTNDYKVEFGPRAAAQVAAALAGYVQDIRAYAKDAAGNPPRVALVSPIYVDDSAPHFADWYTGRYDARSVGISHDIAAELQKTAEDTGSFFLDAALFAAPGADGVHMSLDGHRQFGEKIAIKIIEWLQ
jgi:lysophospholipase L1-like esterase